MKSGTSVVDLRIVSNRRTVKMDLSHTLIRDGLPFLNIQKVRAVSYLHSKYTSSPSLMLELFNESPSFTPTIGESANTDKLL